jgi:uncharacterized membrane protein YfcA
MDILFEIMTLPQFIFACCIALLAGFVKGVVGFAMPMVFISGLSTFLAPELALAGLILPTLVTNVMQSMRQGPRAAWESVKRFRVFLGVGLVTLVLGAQMVRVLEPATMLLVIGVPVVAFACMQLVGWAPSLPSASNKVAVGVGAFTGFMGGLSGIWGPPTVAYLTALNIGKNDFMRVQGVIYGLGAVALTLAHMGSGVLRAQTWPLGIAMVPTAVLGMWIGGQVLDRIDQAMFKRAILVVLLVAGLNLLRRAVMG